ncbi:MAG: hypothetical protein ACOZF0_18470 [Thermodesulfobacteriota bacterium]
MLQKPRLTGIGPLWIVIVFLSLLFTGCSSDSSDDPSSPKTTSTSYHLYSPQLLEAGFTETASIQGNDSDGEQYTGTYETETLQATELDGQTVIPIVTTLSLTQTSSGGTVTFLETTYMTDIDTPFRKVSEPVTYTPEVVSQIPASGIIGDHGSITTWLGNNNTRISGTWSLEDAGSGLANIVIASTTVDTATAATIQTQEHIVTVDASGDSRAISLLITNPEQNFSYSLSGNFD